jgi:hypothetical protein
MRVGLGFGASCLLLCAMLVGCPPMPSAGNGNGNLNGSTNQNGGGSNGNDNSAVQTGILVTTPAGSESLSLDIYELGDSSPLMRAKSVNEVIELPPGLYTVTEYFEAFTFAPSVTVVAGQVSRVELGAIRVTAVAGSEAVIYDIYDEGSATLLDRVNDTDETRAVPAGTYLLKEYFNDDFDFSRGVVVIPGQVTTIALGAINLMTAAGAEAETYDIFDETGTMLLDRVNDTDHIRNVPAGAYVLKEYFNESLVFAADVTVVADAITSIQLGAVRYTGGESIYDLYDGSGTMLLARPNDRNVARSVPAGVYVLKDYFGDDILAADVAVTTGAITDAP